LKALKVIAVLISRAEPRRRGDIIAQLPNNQVSRSAVISPAMLWKINKFLVRPGGFLSGNNDSDLFYIFSFCITPGKDFLIKAKKIKLIITPQNQPPHAYPNPVH
jgi:hypothetical protein